MKKEEIICDENIILKKVTLDNTKIKFDTIIKNKDFLGKWLNWVDFYHKEQDLIDYVSKIINEFDNDEGYVYDIYYKDSFAGCISIQGINRLNNNCEIGYWLAEEYNGNGIMTISAHSLIEYAFNELNFHKISIGAATENYPSQNIIKRLGFNLEGTLKDNECIHGKYIDTYVYGMIKEEWNKK